MKVKRFVSKEMRDGTWRVFQRDEYEIARLFKTQKEAEDFIKNASQDGNDYLYLDEE